MSTLPHPGVPRGLIGLGAVLVAAAVLLAGCFGGSPSSSPSAPVVSPSTGGSAPAASASAASASAAPAGALTAGAYAQVMVDGLRVRVGAKPDATAIGSLFFGDVVRIRATAGENGGYTWYEVETFQTANDQPLTGYVAGAKGDTAYLKPLAGKPSPTPSRSPTPVPTPTPTAAASGA